MKTKKWAMGLVFLSTVSAASGQILIKMGTNMLKPNIWSLITDYPLIIGYSLYGLSAAVLIYCLKHGELSVLYPIYAMNFIWVAIMSPVFFPGADSMNLHKWAGVLAVVAGVVLIGLGSREAHND
jgi:multidrug transporter EmrE-like cation transporter